MEPDLIIYVGSRSGGAVALIVLGAIPATLGFVARKACLRAGWESRWANGVWVLITGGLASLLYVSLVSGFYELRAHAEHVELRYFVPAVSSTLAWTDIARADARPATKNQWRLQLTDAAGHHVMSAMGNRRQIEAAVNDVRRRLATSSP